MVHQERSSDQAREEHAIAYNVCFDCFEWKSM